MKSLQYRQVLLFSVPVFILIGSIFYALYQTQELKDSLRWSNQAYQGIIDLESLVLNTSESESLCLNYLLTENENSLKNYDSTLALINEDLGRARAMILD